MASTRWSLMRSSRCSAAPTFCFVCCMFVCCWLMCVNCCAYVVYCFSCVCLLLQRRADLRPLAAGGDRGAVADDVRLQVLGNLTSQIALTFLCAAFAMENDRLRKSPQLSAKLPRKLRRQMSKSWLAKLPSSASSLISRSMRRERSQRPPLAQAPIATLKLAVLGRAPS